MIEMIIFHLQSKKCITKCKNVKMSNFWSFSVNLGGPETSFEILKTHQIFNKCFIPCMFSSEKHLVIFSPKKLTENTKNV